MNLVIITPDQLRADFLGCYGHPSIGSRHIDDLARRGVRFEHAYCASPACGPSRISFTTSTYVGEHNHRSYGSVCSPDIPNLVTSLHQAGYYTGMFGKNHCFHYDRLLELWDELDLVQMGNYDRHPEFEHAFSAFKLQSDHKYNITGRLTDGAVDFLKRSPERKQPFFLWVNYQDPHPAFCCPEPYDTLFDPDEVPLPRTWNAYDKDRQPVRMEVFRRHTQMENCDEATIRRSIATYMGQIRYVDDAVGRIISQLKALNLMEDTIVLFFSDHGELAGDYNLTHKLPTFYECLARIPVILKIPGVTEDGSSFRGLVEEVDLTPTLLEALGLPIPQTMVGQSLLPALTERDDRGRDSVLVESGGGGPTVQAPIPGLKLKAPLNPTNQSPGAMVRQGDWKICAYHDDRFELYNLAEDPDELTNLAEDPAYTPQMLRMQALLLRRLLGVKVRKHWSAKDFPRDIRFEPLEGPDGLSMRQCPELNGVDNSLPTAEPKPSDALVNSPA
jgi:arylsulfatase A-like enzyme